VNLPHATPANEEQIPADSAEITSGLRVAFVAEPLAAEPGQTVALALHWFLEDPLHALPDLRLQWHTAPDAPLVASAALPMHATVPMTAWPVEQWVRQIVALQPPLTLPAGDYVLSLIATDDGTIAAQRPFTILPSRRNFTPPPLAVTYAQDFGQAGEVTAQVRFLGLSYALPATVTAATPLTLDLAWQSTAPSAPPADYVVTLQLWGADGWPVAQTDQPLPGGSATWLPGQVEVQSLTLPIPAEAGDYRLILALYHATPDGFPRLLTPAGDDFVLLGAIRVSP